jgi:hypothetical protein
MERPTPDVLKDYQKDIDARAQQQEKEKEEYVSNRTALKTKRMKQAEQYGEVIEEIKQKYKDGKVKEPHLIKAGIKKIIPQMCVKCETYKVFPYDFLTRQGFDNGSNKCSVCMAENTAQVKKYTKPKKFECQCGLKFVSNQTEAYYIHMADKTHETRIAKVLRGVRYSQKELREIAKINKIPYYKNLSMPDLVKQLDALKDKLKLE